MNIYTDLDRKGRIVWLRKQGFTVHERPYEVYLEVTRGCNRSCKFCGVPQKDKGKKEGFKFLSWEDFNRYFIPWPESVKKWTLTGVGEPLWNPNVCSFISTIKELSPYAQVSVITNGDPIRKHPYLLDLLLSSGVNFVHWDVYDTPSMEFAVSVQGRIEELGYQVHVNGGSEIWTKHDSKAKVVSILDGRQAFLDKNPTRRFHYWAGSIPFKDGEKYTTRRSWKDLPLRKTCSYPFKHCSISYTGIVSPCCIDALGSLQMGNLNRESLEDVWTGQRFQALRFLVKTYRRDLVIPCSLCVNHTFRDGLYPYWGYQWLAEEAKRMVDRCTVLNSTQEENWARLKEVNNGA